MTWFHHYVVLDFYSQVWPNLAASAITATWAVRRIRRHLANHRKWMKLHFEALHRSNRTLNSRVASASNTSEPTVFTVQSQSGKH